MAWTNVEPHVFSDRWRVSSLVWAFVELMLGFIVLLCAIISIITTRLIRSSGLCLSCHSCEVDRGREAGAQPELCQNSQDKPQHLADNSNNSRHLGKDGNMGFTCKKSTCALHLSDCSCSSANESSTPPLVCGKVPFKCSPPPVHVNYSSSLENHCCSRNRQEGDASCELVDSFSSEIVDDPSAYERSVRDASIVAGKPSGPHNSECRLCNLVMSSEPSLSGRPLKRKFAKVFPDHTRDGSPRDPAQKLGDTESGIAKKTPVCGIHHNHGDRDDAGISLNLDQEEMVVDDECADGDQLSAMPKQFVVSDAEDAENLRRASWEESSGNSSQDSFTFIRRFPVNYGRSVVASGNRNGEGVSSDSQFAGEARGDITPEWSGSYEVSHSFDEMEGGSSVANQDDDDGRLEYCGVKELREALRTERKALAELYNELEQERSASATAANEAMAMITRLQEEKAAAQMECRQFQRIAEEKQMYDQEAIALLQDILLRRDKEMFHLEEEAGLYRQRLLALTMDELDAAGVDPSQGPKKKSDFLLIERETLLLESSDEWKNKRDSSEERLLAEIKEWVTAANEKIAAKSPAKVPTIKEDEESGEKGRLSWKISNMSIDSGRKNLLDSFSLVGEEEENQRDGAVTEAGAGSEAGTEETPARNEDAAAAAGYESFHHMMDSLRKEPRLRDEASLETLNKIEEKFQKQSRKGQVRNEDDLRRIWRNTLRSFGPAAGEISANRALIKQDPKGQMQRTTDNSGLMSGIVRDAEANRAMEEKRISVLEYVWKFEEQLHQGGAKKPALQLGRASSSDINKSEKSGSSASDLALDDQSVREASMEFSATESEREKTKRLTADGRLPPVVSRFRRHASEGDRFRVRGEVAPSSKIAVESQERRSERSFRREDDESSEGSVVHDVYEVQRDSLDTSTPKMTDSIFDGDVRKSVSSTSNRLMRAESAYYPESDVYMEFLGDHGDRLGKPDPLPGYHSAEHRRSYSQTGTGLDVTSSAEGYSLEQVFEGPATSTSGRFRDTVQAAGQRTPQTPSPIAVMGDVVDQLTGRLRTLEADRETMQQTISSLRAENGDMQLLREIAQQLRELRGSDQKGINNSEPHGPSQASSIKGMLSFSRLRCTVQAQLNKLARVFLRNVELGVCRGDQHVGLCRLLQISPLRPSRVTRGAEATAEEIVSNGPQEGSFHPAATRASSLLSQHSWPMDARERSGTALSGWDY